MTYTISREIGIDAGHRVPTHGSKCKNLHGHRYKIQAICESESLQEVGEQKDMTLDFGFLKEEMVAVIDRDCDHGLIFWHADPLVEHLVKDEDMEMFDNAIDTMKRAGYGIIPGAFTVCGRIYLIPEIPTVEVLAKHWFDRLEPRVTERSRGVAVLAKVKVWETPNCWASYEKSLDLRVLKSQLIRESHEGR